jgi:phosphatidylserine/phosphatidylglycerophosphate/cardiolipin synthase-like enzyme
LCDPAYQNCRTPLIDLIRNETVGIDVAFWFMEDARYTYELINRFKAGVPVRVIVDPRANSSNPLNADRLKELSDAGIPMRKRTASGILHWKSMIFAGQATVEFSGANYSGEAFKYNTPYTDYVDEAIFFTSTTSVVTSFMTKYDEMWTNTSAFANYANISAPLVRRYPTSSLSVSLDFPPDEDYAARSVNSYNAEATAIDAIIYRITDRRHTDALINAIGRGVKVRIVTEQKEYRDPNRLWDAWNVDRLYMAGAQIRQRGHAGLNHQKLVILRGQQQIIFGSSNWTTPSANAQAEHNYWTQKSWIYSWFVNQFDRKWGNQAGYTETQAFTPLPPDKPVYVSPSQGTRVSTSVTLKWNPGPWAHKADIYLGTSSTPSKIKSDVAVTPNSTMSITINNLQPGQTYYWKIVDKTMANQAASGAVWYFGT